MNVLLSINPEHVQNIFSGSKRFEFRRRAFGRKDIETVFVYCTKPIGMLVGEFDIEEIVTGSPEDIWELTQFEAGISKCFYDQYFEKRETAVALKIGGVRLYDDPINPNEVLANFTPPQSYMYIERDGDSFVRPAPRGELPQLEMAV